MNEREGTTDEGLRYRLLRTPDEAPPIVMEVEAPRWKHWTDEAASALIGQSFGLSYQGRVLLLYVVGVRRNPLTGHLELICK